MGKSLQTSTRECLRLSWGADPYLTRGPDYIAENSVRASTRERFEDLVLIKVKSSAKMGSRSRSGSERTLCSLFKISTLHHILIN